ncbi:hypothetical protein M0805_001727 [Coniferiporia weirii]|nr:hypothetical protein M0805_001727 [Coniferiporia weirii]
MIPIRTLTALILGCLLTLNVHASLLHERSSGHHIDAHRRLVQHRAPSESIAKVRRSTDSSKRCKARTSTATSTSTSLTSSSTYVAKSTSSTWTPTSSSSKPKETSSSNKGGSISGASAATGLINVVSTCGDIGATKDVTAVSGPNGDIDWLNCGVNSGGWQPPNVQVSDLVAVDLSWAVQQANTPFSACSDYISLFEQYGNQYGIPPIMLASFAMQESSCNPNTVGGAGEQGLMQLTKDKCGDAPGGNCKDPDYNIRTGASYFSSSLASNNYNVLLTIGMYNGWTRGLTYDEATAAAYTSCCRCQNNLDYLHQFVNGWLQNVDAYTNNPALGKYFNLNKCN